MTFINRFFVLIFLCAISLSTIAAEHLRLATTTSTENSGLLAHLLPVFEEDSGIHVDVIAVGTGKALRLGKNGDVDLVMVHAPAAEKQFVANGYGLERKPLMHNDFVILGMPDDPAGLRQATSLKQAFTRLYNNQQIVFVSRGDDSGTHKKEQELWKLAGFTPRESQYLSVGQGMGATMRIANEKQAYTLSDRGTFLALKKTLDLQIVFEQVPELLNPYHMIVVNPERHPHIKQEEANAFINFLQGPKGQQLIRDFRIEGEPLFIPDVIP